MVKASEAIPYRKDDHRVPLGDSIMAFSTGVGQFAAEEARRRPTAKLGALLRLVARARRKACQPRHACSTLYRSFLRVALPSQHYRNGSTYHA